MDWGKYLFCRFNAAPGIDMNEMSVHLKPSTWNVPLLSCATEPHFCSFLPQLSQKQKWIECHSAFFQLRLVAKQLQTSFSYSSLPCQQRQRSLCSMYVRCCMYQNASLLLGIILMSVNLFSWDAEEMVCCPLGVIPFSHMFSELVWPFEGLFTSPICWQQEATILWNSYSEGIDCCVTIFYSHFYFIGLLLQMLI